jgi:hypothetical protein
VGNKEKKMFRIVHLPNGSMIKADVVASFERAINNDFNLRPGYGSTDFWNFVESDMYMDLSGIYASSYIDECFEAMGDELSEEYLEV